MNQTRCAKPALIGLLLVACTNAYGQAFSDSIAGPAWSDAAGWNNEEYYLSIRALDFNGDGWTDLCARSSAGVRCFLNSSGTFGTPLTSSVFSANQGTAPSFYTTVRVATTNRGDEDYCMRLAGDMTCLLAIGDLSSISSTPIFTDASRWDAPEHYSTLRTLDFTGDGTDDICGRSDEGMTCYRRIAATQFSDTPIAGPAWRDSSGWNQAKFYRTIRVLDFNGDGRDDLCARSSAGMDCYASLGSSFGSLMAGPSWDDFSGWDQIKFYDTIRALDFNGDGMDDLCARSSIGMRCHASLGNGFRAPIMGPDWTDASGWDRLKFYRTIRVLDYNGDGKDDLCARSSVGIECFPSTGNGWGEPVAGPAWSDASGWDDPDHYETILTIDLNRDGFDDLCARSSVGMTCAASRELLLSNGFE